MSDPPSSPSTDTERPRIPRHNLRPGRTFLVLVPLHVVAFVALYLGTMNIVQKEILKTHSHDASILMDEALNDLHPLMVSHSNAEAQKQLQGFINAHELLAFKLYGPDGVLVGDNVDKPIDEEIARFLEEGLKERFQFERDGDQLTLHGLLRLDPEEACQECHAANRLIGVASMNLDMTPQVAAAHDRMGRSMAVLILIWVVLVGVMNIIASRMARHSVATLEAGMDGDGASPLVSATGGGSVFLDPVSARLYESLRQTLEHQRERDAEVSSRLHHTERLASLGQLAAGLAHEIKNPLAGIHGVLELLRDENEESDEVEGDRTTELYNEMLAELNRVNDTIHLLLSFARPPSPRRVRINPRDLLESTTQLMRPGLAKRSIKLEVSTAPDLPEIALDPDQIRQVLVNLISNAADAIEKNGTITVKATGFPDGQGLILAVEDDGPGISEQALEEIFEPFYTTKFSGTGLGLSVVRSQVQQHGGRIEIESKPSKGTTFFVLLPRPGVSNQDATEGEA